jgi:hypothetical protein
MKSSYIKYIALSINLAICAIVLLPLGAHAINAPDIYTPLAPLPNLENMQPMKEVSFKTYVTYVFNLLIALGAVAAVFEITWGGFEYMTTDAVSGKTDGLKRIQNAIYGLLLILCSYLILKTIDPRFVSIPSSLVTPLQMNQSYDATSFQDTMNGVSAGAQNQADNATQANNQAKANVSDLQQQLSDAKIAANGACIDPTTTSRQCADAMNKEAVIQDKLNQAQAVAGYHQNATSITNTIYSGGDAVNGANGANTNTFQQNDTATLNAAQAAENSAYNNAIAAANGDPQAIQTINAEHAVTTAGINANLDYINAEYGKITPGTAIDNINAQITAANNAAAANPGNTNLQTEAQQVSTAGKADITQLKSLPGYIRNTGGGSVVPFSM